MTKSSGCCAVCFTTSLPNSTLQSSVRMVCAIAYLGTDFCGFGSPSRLVESALPASERRNVEHLCLVQALPRNTLSARSLRGRSLRTRFHRFPALSEPGAVKKAMPLLRRGTFRIGWASRGRLGIPLQSRRGIHHLKFSRREFTAHGFVWRYASLFNEQIDFAI